MDSTLSERKLLHGCDGALARERAGGSSDVRTDPRLLDSDGSFLPPEARVWSPASGRV